MGELETRESQELEQKNDAHLLDIQDEQIQTQKRLQRLDALLQFELSLVPQPILSDALSKLLQPLLTLFHRPLPSRTFPHSLKYLRLEINLENFSPRI